MRYTNFSQAVALTLGVLAVCFLIGYIVLAWTEPTQAPPGGNVPTPLNTGNAGQSKEGGLILNTGGAANGLIVQSGKVGIGLSDVGIYKMGVGGHLYVGGNVLINGGDLKLGGNLLDSAGNIIYNDSTKKIERNRLPFNQGDIVSDWETSAWDAGYYNVANLVPENVKNGVSFGREQTGTLSSATYKGGYIVASFPASSYSIECANGCRRGDYTTYIRCEAGGIGVCESHSCAIVWVGSFENYYCDKSCADFPESTCSNGTYYTIRCANGNAPIYVAGLRNSDNQVTRIYICLE